MNRCKDCAYFNKGCCIRKTVDMQGDVPALMFVSSRSWCDKFVEFGYKLPAVISTRYLKIRTKYRRLYAKTKSSSR